MIEIILEALFDGIKTFAVIFVIYFIFSFLEFKVANALKKGNKLSPLYGAITGLIPQCGVSVVGADLYVKKHITLGTLIAIFITCSDEAIPILLGGGKNCIIAAIGIVVIKLALAFIVGYFIDSISTKKEVAQHLKECDHQHITSHCGCCHHCIDEEEDKFDKHIWHPFVHSIKLFGYILLINIILNSFVFIVGKNNFISFLEYNKYLTPLYSVVIGLIPNCVSSVILAELFVEGAISFGAILSGLIVNAGLGMMILFKEKSLAKKNILILLLLMALSIIVGYTSCFVLGF